jgi:diguanylate cyclase
LATRPATSCCVRSRDGYIASPADAATLAARFIETMRQPFELPDRKVTLSCSIGIAIYPDHGHRDRLLACADAAMYNAKRAGGGCSAIFESHMDSGASDQLDLQQALREALEHSQLRLAYQPKIDAENGALVGVEALLRWTHPVRGPIGPAVFVPVAERFGLIVPIGRWVIDESMRQLAAWSAQGLHLTMSINISGYQMRNLDAVERLVQAMSRHGIDPAQVICEITESVAMEDAQVTQQVIEAISAAGVRLSIDDFGTGYSSLASLRQLRIQELKIDRSFVKDVATSSDARAMVDAVVHLAHALGLRVVAEGVETPAQRDVLRQLRADELQGYHYAPALPPAEVAAMAVARRPAVTEPMPLQA